MKEHCPLLRLLRMNSERRIEQRWQVYGCNIPTHKKNRILIPFWPNKKSTADKPYSKLNKDDCQVMKEPSVFELPDGKSLACMDIKKTGICNTLKNN